MTADLLGFYGIEPLHQYQIAILVRVYHVLGASLIMAA